LRGQAVHGELEAVRAEGIGLDPVGARLDVFGVNGLDDPGIVEIEHVEAGVERHAAGIEHGAHRAVAEERPLADALEEGRGHQTACRRRSASAAATWTATWSGLSVVVSTVTSALA